MSFFIYILAGLVLVVAKTLQVNKQLSEGTYSWKSSAVLFFVWGLLVLPGINAACADVTCQWGVNFGWWLGLIRDIQIFNGFDAETMPIVVLLAASALTVYVLGHVFGWIFHAGQKLLQVEA